MKKAISLICAFMMCICLSGCVKKEKPKEEIYIVATGDVHCGVEANFTMASVKAYVDDLKAEHDNVILVDTGDYIQGGAMGSLSKGSYIIDIMNETGYDYVTFGNHEFDYGMDELRARIEQMNFQPIASNAIYKGNKTSVFDGVPEYVIRDFNGTKLGILGLLTPESFQSSTPANFKENDEYVYDFYGENNGQDLYDHVQSLVDQMREEGADYVVVLSHLGYDTKICDSISLISHTSGIDAVMDGHAHALIPGDYYPNKNGEDVLMSSVGTQLQEVGTIIIEPDGKISCVHMVEYDRKDEGVLNKIAEINRELDTILSEPVGTADFELSIYDEEGIRITRTRETGIGNLMADALRLYDGYDIGVINAGGVRTGIPAGEITYGSLLDNQPFQNSYSVIRLTGQQFLDAAEYVYSNVEPIYKLDGKAVGESGAFWCLSGVKLTIDTSIKSPVVMDEIGQFDHFEGEERRVKDVYVLQNGEYVPIDPEKEYTLASTDYVVLQAGDGNTILNDCEVVVGASVSDVEVTKAFVEKYGVDEKYSKVEGRIIVK